MSNNSDNSNKATYNSINSYKNNLNNSYKSNLKDNLIMSNTEISCNNQIDEFDTIQLCPEEEDYNFTIIPNELIRDQSISPECRWLIIYLLSNKPGWRINTAQVRNHLKGHKGRDSVRNIFKEACESGYMKRVEIKKPNNKGGGLLNSGYKYFVSKTPKFKNRETEIQTPGAKAPENKAYKNTIEEEKLYAKKEQENLTKDAAVDDLPKKPDKTANADSADASCDISFSAEIKEFGDIIITELKRIKPDFKKPKSMKQIYSNCKFMVELDKRNISRALEILKSALKDEFWRDKFFKPNPAEYLRKKFDQLEIKFYKPPTVFEDNIPEDEDLAAILARRYELEELEKQKKR